MSNVNPCASASWLHPARWANLAYQSGPQVLSETVAKAGGGSERAKWWGGFLKKQVDTDFCEFASTQIGSGGKKLFRSMIAEPPRGALLLLLYPGTMGPRLYRAWERGNEDHDRREFYDVLRRDGTAITFFVFALPIMVNALSRWMQNKSGVNLLTKAKNVLSYSQFKNYEMDLNKPDSAKNVLKAILAEGNAEGLQKALHNVHFRGDDEALSKSIQEMKGAASTLTQAYRDHLAALIKANLDAVKPEQQAALARRALEAVENHPGQNFLQQLLDKLTGIEAQRGELVTKAASAGETKLVEAAAALKGDLGGALVKFAKERRLPADLSAFLLVVGLIGWLPVNANRWWNQRQYDKKHASNAKPSVKPQPAKALVAQQPAVAFHGMRSQQAAYTPTTMGSYGMQPPYLPVTNNPFHTSYY